MRRDQELRSKKKISKIIIKKPIEIREIRCLMKQENDTVKKKSIQRTKKGLLGIKNMTA